MVILQLEQPGRAVVVLDHELVQRLEAALKLVPPSATGLVLASSSERVFVAGADLRAISELDDAQLTAYLEYAARVFGMIAGLPFPTVAAINGAALGGGLELAMHCDGLVASPPHGGNGKPAKPYPVGLPECALGLCPGWGGTNLLPARMDPAGGILRTAAGQTMMFDEASGLGLFDRIAPSAEQLRETALAWLSERPRVARPEPRNTPGRWIGQPERAAATLKALDSMELPQTPSARAVREAVEAGLSQGWEAATAVERRRLVELRHTPEARAALAAFFERSAAPKPGAA